MSELQVGENRAVFQSSWRSELASYPNRKQWNTGLWAVDAPQPRPVFISIYKKLRFFVVYIGPIVPIQAYIQVYRVQMGSQRSPKRSRCFGGPFWGYFGVRYGSGTVRYGTVFSSIECKRCFGRHGSRKWRWLRTGSGGILRLMNAPQCRANLFLKKFVLKIIGV